MIRAGKYITLAELFWFVHKACSCVDLYRAYLSLPGFIYKRFHSKSHSESGQMLKKAKTLGFVEKGVWGLPAARR